jgi:hypothetical protein
VSGCEHCGAVGPHTCHRITPDADALAFREGILRRDRDALAMERDHYRERAQTLRARFDWAQHVAAEAMREGLACAEWQRTCLASERARGDAARRAATLAETERDTLRALTDSMRADNARLRAAMGRTAPPTDAEWAAIIEHDCTLIVTAEPSMTTTVATRGELDALCDAADEAGEAYVWIVVGADGWPRPWPTGGDAGR